MRFIVAFLILVSAVRVSAQVGQPTTDVRRFDRISGTARDITDFFFAPRSFVSIGFTSYHDANFLRDFTAVTQSLYLAAEGSFGQGYYYGGRLAVSRDFVNSLGFRPSAYLGHIGHIKLLELHLQGDVYYERISGALAPQSGLTSLVGLIYPVKLSRSLTLRPGLVVSPQWYNYVGADSLKNSLGVLPDFFSSSLSLSLVYRSQFMISAQLGMFSTYRLVATRPRWMTETHQPVLDISVRYMFDSRGRENKLLKFY